MPIIAEISTPLISQTVLTTSFVGLIGVRPVSTK